MNSSRLKTLVIIILLLINTVFLGLYLMDRYSSDSMQSDAKKKLVRVLAEQGITLDEKIIPGACPKERFALIRDTDREKELAETILGPVNTEEKGGSIYLYENNNGFARFAGNGEFEIIINSFPMDDKSAAELSENLLDKMGISAERIIDDSLSAENAQTVSYTCLYMDSRIFNGLLAFTFTSDGKAEIAGKSVLGTVAPLNNTDVMNPATALISFVNEINANNIECGEITGIESGYHMVASTAGNTLEPVWQIRTDGAECYLDLGSGKLVVI